MESTKEQNNKKELNKENIDKEALKVISLIQKKDYLFII